MAGNSNQPSAVGYASLRRLRGQSVIWQGRREASVAIFPPVRRRLVRGAQPGPARRLVAVREVAGRSAGEHSPPAASAEHAASPTSKRRDPSQRLIPRRWLHGLSCNPAIRATSPTQPAAAGSHIAGFPVQRAGGGQTRHPGTGRRTRLGRSTAVSFTGPQPLSFAFCTTGVRRVGPVTGRCGLPSGRESIRLHAWTCPAHCRSK